MVPTLRTTLGVKGHRPVVGTLDDKRAVYVFGAINVVGGRLTTRQVTLLPKRYPVDQHKRVMLLVEELGGQTEHIARMRRIVTRLTAGARQTSVLTSLIEPAETVAPGIGGDTGQRYEDLGLLGRGGMGEDQTECA